MCATLFCAKTTFISRDLKIKICTFLGDILGIMIFNEIPWKDESGDTGKVKSDHKLAYSHIKLLYTHIYTDNDCEDAQLLAYMYKSDRHVSCTVYMQCTCYVY